MPSSATVTSHELDSADRTANRHSFKVMVTRSMKRTCDKRCFRRAVQILFLSAITVVSCARGTSFRPARLDFFGKRTRTAVEVARTRPIVACWVLRTNTPDGLARSFAIRRGWGKSCDYLEFIDDATPGIQVDWVEKYEDISAKSYRAWEFMHDKYVNISQTDTTMVDFVLKADVDTYIIWENALTFLRRFDSALPHYIGRELVDPRDGAFVAGAAIILSKQALRSLYEATRTGSIACSRKDFASHKQAEDVALAHCLKEVGIYPQNTRDASGAERFMVFNPQKMYSGDDPLPRWYMKRSLNTKRGAGCCSAEAIAFHYVSAEELAEKTPVFKDGVWSWTQRKEY